MNSTLAQVCVTRSKRSPQLFKQTCTLRLESDPGKRKVEEAHITLYAPIAKATPVNDNTFPSETYDRAYYGISRNYVA